MSKTHCQFCKVEYAAIPPYLDGPCCELGWADSLPEPHRTEELQRIDADAKEEAIRESER